MGFQASDESALSLTRQQRELIEGNRDTLLFDDARRAWWTASQMYRRRLGSQRNRWVAAVAAVVLLALGFGVFSIRQRYADQEENRALTAQSELRGILANRRGDLDGLVGLARDYDYDWDKISGGLGAEVVENVDGGVFATAPWERTDFDPEQLFSVIERGHRLFVPSRSLFGAMSFALEEIWLRSSDALVRDRARALSETVLAAFIAYHKERTPNFQLPPARAAEDTLNVWVALPAGEFVMGSQDGDSDERPHPVRVVSGFSMQQQEVTNEEYRRFDPAHDFSAGQERHPVVNVSWYEAAGYAAWLGASLPTEAEWEYAARGTGQEPPSGRKGRPYPWGFEPVTPQRAVSGGSGTKPVDSLGKPSQTPEGLTDMAGNVWEWCRDWYGPYAVQIVSDPLGPIARDAEKPEGAPLRVLRGGSFLNSEFDLRAAFRFRFDPDNRFVFVGFRVVSSRLRP